METSRGGTTRRGIISIAIIVFASLSVSAGGDRGGLVQDAKKSLCLGPHLVFVDDQEAMERTRSNAGKRTEISRRARSLINSKLSLIERLNEDVNFDRESMRVLMADDQADLVAGAKMKMYVQQIVVFSLDGELRAEFAIERLTSSRLCVEKLYYHGVVKLLFHYGTSE